MMMQTSSQLNRRPCFERTRMAFVLLCVACVTGCQQQPPSSAASKPPAAAQRPALAGGAGAAGAPTNALVQTPLVRQLVFDSLKVGRDPFFPNTTRRPQVVATNDPQAAAVAAAPALPASAYMKLTALWAVKPRALAYINKTDFRPGEEGTVTIVVTNSQNKIERRKVSVRCLEIRADSVVISVEGEPGTKELRMP